MTGSVRIDGSAIDPRTLSPEAKAQIERIRYVEARIAELSNTQALLRRAQKSYIDELQREIVKARSGVDLTNFLSD